MTEKWYTLSHQWLKVLGEIVVVGISAHAAQSLKKIRKVTLPVKGASVKAGKSAGTVCGERRTVAYFCPVSGTVVEINENAVLHPEIVSGFPENDGWLFKMRMTQVKDLIPLLSSEQYRRVIAFREE